MHLQSSRIKSESPFVSVLEASSREQWAERGSKGRPWMPDAVRAVWVWGSRGQPHFHYRESEHTNFSSNTSVCCHRNVKAPSAGGRECVMGELLVRFCLFFFSSWIKGIVNEEWPGRCVLSRMAVPAEVRESPSAPGRLLPDSFLWNTSQQSNYAAVGLLLGFANLPLPPHAQMKLGIPEGTAGCWWSFSSWS